MKLLAGILAAFVVGTYQKIDARPRLRKKTPPAPAVEKKPVLEENNKPEELVVEKQLSVRICLATCEKKETCTWNITAEKGFFIAHPERPESKHSLAESALKITFEKGVLAINGKKVVGSRIKISPQEGHFYLNGIEYSGALVFWVHDDLLYLINSDVDIEDYVASVVQAESWPGWPLEVNKAFSIVCRSYVLAHSLEKRQRKKNIHSFYDLWCTNKHQTYKGWCTSSAVRQAVEETKGVILAHDNKPILAMYDSCCGGVVPAHVEGLDFLKTPYLARAYPCTACQSCKIYSWSIAYDLALLNELFSSYLHGDKIKDLVVTNSDKAGVVQHLVIITTKNKKHTITGAQVYGALKDIKSRCFTIKKNGKKITFYGKGYGHHRGLCQWGARQLIKDGWHYKNVLTFYYPKVSFMKMTVR